MENNENSHFINLNSIEKYSNYANQVKDNQLKQICKANEQVERNHLDTINQLLNGKIPEMNQQQNQNPAQNLNNTQTGGSNLSDKDICSDLLMTEKMFRELTILQFLNLEILMSVTY